MDNTNLFFLIYNSSNHSSVLDTLMLFATTYLLYITMFLMFVLAFKGGVKEKKALILTVLAIPLAILLIKVIHLFYLEPRPFVTYHFSPLTDNIPDPSFPSRHATLSSVIAFSYLYFKSKWSYLFLIIMFWIGLSRIYVGVHYPMDIAGGFLVGIISLIIAKQVTKYLKFKIIPS